MDSVSKGGFFDKLVFSLAFVLIAFWTQPVAALNNSCIDTDGGINYYLRGDVSGALNGSEYRFSDYCMGSGRLKEYYCSGTDYAYVTYNCTCSNGACTNATKETTPLITNASCNDTDGGADYYVRGTASGQFDNGTNYSYRDYCPSRSYLKEYFCNETRVESQVHYCTAQQCVNGACRGSRHPQSCNDTDGGKSYGVKGTVYGYRNGAFYNSTDFCATGSMLNEYFCSNQTALSTQYPCACVNGYCLGAVAAPASAEGGTHAGYAVGGDQYALFGLITLLLIVAAVFWQVVYRK